MCIRDRIRLGFSPTRIHRLHLRTACEADLIKYGRQRPTSRCVFPCDHVQRRHWVYYGTASGRHIINTTRLSHVCDTTIRFVRSYGLRVCSTRPPAVVTTKAVVVYSSRNEGAVCFTAALLATDTSRGYNKYRHTSISREWLRKSDAQLTEMYNHKMRCESFRRLFRKNRRGINPRGFNWVSSRVITKDTGRNVTPRSP